MADFRAILADKMRPESGEPESRLKRLCFSAFSPSHTRLFIQQHIRLVENGVCGFFFSTALACALAVWFSGHDMRLIIPVLVLGWCLAAVGWWWAPNLSQKGRILWLVISAAIFVVLYVHSLGESDLAKKRDSEIKIARSWIALSGDILADTHAATYDFHIPIADQKMAPELRDRLWQEENQRANDDFKRGITTMKQKYSGRIAEAQIEMKNMNIPLVQGITRLDEPLVNSFSFEAWASKLGGEGRRILIENGEVP